MFKLFSSALFHIFAAGRCLSCFVAFEKCVTRNCFPALVQIDDLFPSSQTVWVLIMQESKSVPQGPAWSREGFFPGILNRQPVSFERAALMLLEALHMARSKKSLWYLFNAPVLDHCKTQAALLEGPINHFLLLGLLAFSYLMADCWSINGKVVPVSQLSNLWRVASTFANMPHCSKYGQRKTFARCSEV